MICLLLQQDEWTALHYASSKGHTDVVELLLNHNADINVVTKVTYIMRMIVVYSNLQHLVTNSSYILPCYALIYLLQFKRYIVHLREWCISDYRLYLSLCF